MGEIGFCTTNDILKEVTRLLITDITTDSGIPLLLVRALHNKPLYFFLTSLRCYLQYFDTSQLIIFVSPILYPYIAFSLLFHFKKSQNCHSGAPPRGGAIESSVSALSKYGASRLDPISLRQLARLPDGTWLADPSRMTRCILLTLILFPLIFIFNPFSWSLGTKIYIYQGFFMVLAVVGFVKAFLSLVANTLHK